MSFAAIMLIALALDGLLGWPPALFARIGHPVTWMGALIELFDSRFNRGAIVRRRLMGGVTVAAVLAVVIVVTWSIQSMLPSGFWGILFAAILAWPFIAARSMYDHVGAVADPLGRGDLSGARAAVAMIVGRDPSQLDEAGVARASLESLAENTSDGIVAPLFWGVIAGLPGLAAYKAINTMDSMIGHRTERHEAFGMVAARLDDVVNLIPARLTGLFFVAVSGDASISLKTMLADANRHRSPNAGWPEAAMAGALGVRLSGPRRYGTEVSSEPWLNAAAPDPDAATITAGLAVFLRAMFLSALILVVLAAI